MTLRSNTDERKLFVYFINHESVELGRRMRRASRTSNRETTKTPLVFQSFGLADSGVAVKNDWIQDKAILESLDLLDHLGLLISRTVVVNDTESTLQSNVNSHIMFSNGIHGGGDKWSLERDPLGDWRIENDFGSSKSNVTGKNEEIIVGQASVLLGVEEGLDIQSIALFILFKDLKSLGAVQKLIGRAKVSGSRLRVAVCVRHLECGKEGGSIAEVRNRIIGFGVTLNELRRQRGGSQIKEKKVRKSKLEFFEGGAESHVYMVAWKSKQGPAVKCGWCFSATLPEFWLVLEIEI